MLKVFVSSTFTDLGRERKELIGKLDKAIEAAAMEKFIPHGNTSQEEAVSELRGSDVVIFLISPLYGTLLNTCVIEDCSAPYTMKADPKVRISYTHCEYNITKAEKKPPPITGSYCRFPTFPYDNLFKTPHQQGKGDPMNVKEELTRFLDGLVIGFLVAAILLFLFLYADFVPAYSILLALLVGGCVAGLISRGAWKGGVSAFFSGFFALFLFQMVGAPIIDYTFPIYLILIGLLFSVAGGIIGGFLTRPTTLVVVPSSKEPQKVYVCPNCQAEIPMKTKFCPECGVRLGKPTLTEKIKGIKEGGEKS